VIEIRDGSDLVLQQCLWVNRLGGYIDELAQVAVNGNPFDDPDFDPDDPDHDFRGCFALHDANFNVRALVDESGAVVERYEYTPYGERTVYFSPGTNDPLAMNPALLSQRVEVAGIAQPYGINTVGHQGLFHDEAIGLIHNRDRILHPRFGRFNQPDQLWYVDGMNLYEYVGSNPLTWLDPLGRAKTTIKKGLGAGLYLGLGADFDIGFEAGEEDCCVNGQTIKGGKKFWKFYIDVNLGIGLKGKVNLVGKTIDVGLKGPGVSLNYSDGDETTCGGSYSGCRHMEFSERLHFTVGMSVHLVAGGSIRWSAYEEFRLKAVSCNGAPSTGYIEWCGRNRVTASASFWWATRTWTLVDNNDGCLIIARF
jgi:RHS repeat-associated protein